MVQVRLLDTLVGQFRNNYQIISDADIGSQNLAKYEYVIYVGVEQKTLSPELVAAINRYTGWFYAFGANADQFTQQLPWLTMHGEVVVNSVGPPGGQDQDLTDTLSATDGAGSPPPVTGYLPGDHLFFDVSGGGARVTLTGNRADGQGTVPLALNSGKRFYFAGTNIRPPVDGYVTESLLQFFSQKGTGLTKYLRLEDVSPYADPKLLMEQAVWLKEQHIPYMVAVIAVYEDTDGRRTYLYQRPAVVRALQYMQANGGSIVFHGYTHKYRAEETGEGCEFWDCKYDRPIYQPDNATPKFRSDFATEAEWDSYVKNVGQKFEASYIENVLTRGVQILVAHGLYPLAFEPSHYAISQLGYQIVSQHFSSYVGQIQMSDATWNSGYAPPYESRPTFMHGMTVYPETLGFIEEDNQAGSFRMMQEELASRSQFSQAYLSAFYHPYLGLAGLEKVVGLLNSVPGTWLNLKDEPNLVQVQNIRITTEGGRIHVQQPSFPRFASAYARRLWFRTYRPWAVPAILVLLTAAGFVMIRREIRRDKRSGAAA